MWKVKQRERKKEKKNKKTKNKKKIASAHIEIEPVTFRSELGRAIHWATKADGERSPWTEFICDRRAETLSLCPF